MNRLNLRMPTKYFPEIDLLRGVGVAMMIANHFGYGLLSQQGRSSPIGGSLVLVGSFAPVLFFLTTGIGVGIHRGRPVQWTRVACKVAILFAADAIMMLALSGGLGFDFLAFIGLSTLVCALLTRSKYALTLSAIGFCAFAALRFVAGAALRRYLSHEELYRVNLLVGVESIQEISYPLAPWLCFPFLGFCLSPFIERSREDAQWSRTNLVMLFAGAIALGLSWFAVRNGAYFVRYATVSAAFFGVSLGVVFVLTAVCRVASHPKNAVVGSASRFFEIRGVACLAIVPIHYLLLEVTRSFGWSEFTAGEFVVVLAVAIPVCFLLGRSFENLATATVAAYPSGIIIGGSTFVFAVSVMICYELSSPLPRMFALFCGQAALCILLSGTDGWLPRSAAGRNRESRVSAWD